MGCLPILVIAIPMLIVIAVSFVLCPPFGILLLLTVVITSIVTIINIKKGIK